MDFNTAVDRHLAAVTGRDLDGYLATVHDDVTLVMLNGRVIEGRAAIGEFHRDWFADPDWSWRLTRLSSVETGGTGVVVLAVDYDDLDQHGKPYSMHYLLGLTFTRHGEAWLLVHDQNTPKP
ncbi:nuclear transport factor 2 family protein [Actinoplanes sp. NPDC026619]|uniref:YybH family protein n=1 Tax=Actinoplanes sp. NPDC026619 TaxID=3155798 RepID=UPI0033FE1A4A